MEYYVIGKERLLELLEEENRLNALECAGVKQWSGYEDAKDIYTDGEDISYTEMAYEDLVEFIDIEKFANKNKNEHKKHLQGYIYDSLVYRYQLALYKASLKDAEDFIVKENISKADAEATARLDYNRNLMRFCEILDEAIGEHD